jgi:peptide/nickel transport system permease protein
VSRSAFIVRRLVQTIPLLLGVLLLAFVLLQVAPGDPARTVAGQRASPEELDRVRAELGLDDPLPAQYLNYVADTIRGDLGTAIRKKIPVTEVIVDALPVTLALIGLGAILSLLLAVPLAHWAASGRDRAPDHAVRGFSLLTLTMPTFFVGILLLVFIALPTGWFPVSGYGDSFTDHLRALVLPSVTIAIALAPLLVRSMRSEFIGILNSDYVAMARASGIGGRRMLFRHQLPNAVLPTITLLAVSVGYLLFGIVVVEVTFGLPGLGSEMANAVDGRDYPVIQGITLVFALIVVLTSVAADILYTLIDPRVELR